MAFKFRFPFAILHYIRNGGTDGVLDSTRALQNAIEKARDWALPIAPDKRKRPTLQEAGEWINQIIEDDRRKQEDMANA